MCLGSSGPENGIGLLRTDRGLGVSYSVLPGAIKLYFDA